MLIITKKNKDKEIVKNPGIENLFKVAANSFLIIKEMLSIKLFIWFLVNQNPGGRNKITNKEDNQFKFKENQDTGSNTEKRLDI